ncbi:MAG: hypothetical protein G8345_09005 [Magnetococcales bacterium]|nr:hypothetical protein [Magnetococcales bacterium]NGZ27014.1 hypothetical protein [Magnetococcales bacterium]
MRSIFALVVTVVLMGQTALASILYRNGCETPQPGVEVCWEVNGEAESRPFPLEETLHLLPVVVPGSGDPQILDVYTRSIYRQLLPGNLTRSGIVQEWQPVMYLDEAIRVVRNKPWPMALWISPRVIRNSGPATSGLLDLDLYFIQGKSGALYRTLRLRVESKPEIRRDERENTLASAGAMGLLKALDYTPVVGTLAVGAARAVSPASPAEAGISLELMTEYAFRHMMTLMQYPLESIKPPPS